MFRLDNIRYQFQRYGAQMLRLSSCRGFGIQSPWAYRLMTTVIAVRGCGSETAALRTLHSDLHGSRRSYYELMFRLARSLQPDFFVDTTSDTLAATYVSSGHDSVRVVAPSELAAHHMQSTLMVRTDILCQQLMQIVEQMRGESMLVVDGIRRDKLSIKAWNELRDSQKTGVTIDLYGHALVFFSTARPKQHYRGPCL